MINANDVEPMPDDTGSLLTKAYTAAELQRMTFDPLVEFVPGVITEGTGMLVGGPKLGKSSMALDFTLGCGYGGTVLGKISVEKRDVLYLALEDGPRRLQDRVGRLRPEGLDWPENVTILNVVENGQVLATLQEWYEKHPKSLVILDTLSKNRPQGHAGANAYLEDYAFGTRFKRVVDAHPGSALLTVHHDRKLKSKDFVDNVSGTNGLAGAMDRRLAAHRSPTSSAPPHRGLTSSPATGGAALTATATQTAPAGFIPPPHQRARRRSATGAYSSTPPTPSLRSPSRQTPTATPGSRIRGA